MYKYSFEKLRVWQEIRKFVVLVYKTTKRFPKEERYSLTDQIRRAAVSISANIAEGSSRVSPKDQAHFSQIAYSSLMELLSHFYISYDLEYIEKEPFDIIKSHIFDISNQINGLRKSQLDSI